MGGGMSRNPLRIINLTGRPTRKQNSRIKNKTGCVLAHCTHVESSTNKKRAAAWQQELNRTCAWSHVTTHCTVRNSSARRQQNQPVVRPIVSIRVYVPPRFGPLLACLPQIFYISRYNNMSKYITKWMKRKIKITYNFKCREYVNGITASCYYCKHWGLVLELLLLFFPYTS